MTTKEIILSPTQYDFLTSDHKFTYCTGGYKFGKTWILARKAVKTLIETEQDGLLAEPTYRMNEDLLRPALEDAFKDHNLGYKWVSSESLYRTNYGKVLLRTQDKRNSLEGHNIGWYGLDEMDLLPKEKCKENWRTLISKLTLQTKNNKRIGFGVGTNEGYEFIYEQFYENSEQVAKNQYVRDDHKLFIGSTLENKHLPDGYIETLYANYDEKLVARYINGEFVNIKAGKVYTNFTRDNVINRKIDPNRPLYMSWDVNYSDKPMSTTLIQEFSRQELFGETGLPCYVAVKGFYNKNTNTDVQCQIIYNWLKEQGFNSNIIVYGDRVGHDRRVGAPKSHYDYVREYFNVSRDDVKTRSTRSIIDRVTSVQTMLCNSQGLRRYFIDNENKELITDYEQVVWKSNKNELDQSKLDRTDPTDSASYYFYFEHDLTRIKTKVT